MMRDLTIGVIGAGSTYSPELIDGFLKRQDQLSVKRFVLMDIDQTKLDIVGGLVERIALTFDKKVEVIKTLNMEEAVDGADYVVTQFRVGRLPARARDEKIPLKYDLIGQETTGPGGFAKAMRTIPEILKIARAMEKYSPKSWLINFTNPSGIVTEAVSKYSDVNVIGLCNQPITTHNYIAEELGVASEDLYMDYFGLNHLGWIKRLLLNGEDISAEAFDKIINSPRLDHILGYHFTKDFLKALGLLPTGYLQYYYHTEESLAKLKSQPQCRAEVVMKIEEDILKLYQDPSLNKKPKMLEKRGGAWYSDAAVAVMSAIENDKQELHIVNVPNNGAIEGLPRDSIIEVPAVVGKSGAAPLVVGEVPLGITGLLQHVNAYENLTVKAGAEGCKATALVALCSHPFIKSTDVAKRLLDELISANQPYIQLR